APAALPTSPVEAVAFSWRPVILLLLWTCLGVLLGTVVAYLRGGISMGIAAGAFVTGLLGLFQGILAVAGFGRRDGAILGGLLGSMVGVLYGWLVLDLMMGVNGLFAILLGAIVGGGVMGFDGWLLGLRVGSNQPQATGGREA